jgi:hypothetical protein
MLSHTESQRRIFEVDVDDLFPDLPEKAGPDKAADLLLSHIIVGFEESLRAGMPPMEALAHVLRWVGREMARVDIAQRLCPVHGGNAQGKRSPANRST